MYRGECRTWTLAAAILVLGVASPASAGRMRHPMVVLSPATEARGEAAEARWEQIQERAAARGEARADHAARVAADRAAITPEMRARYAAANASKPDFWSDALGLVEKSLPFSGASSGGSVIRGTGPLDPVYYAIAHKPFSLPWTGTPSTTPTASASPPEALRSMGVGSPTTLSGGGSTHAVVAAAQEMGGIDFGAEPPRPAPVPEPSSIAVAVVLVIGAGWYRSRSRRA